jgi:hypothetical protein|tara:strand:- start:900 stop:1472 length:573 start_codon:yes stop_codon:yes gene_type:complete
MSALEEYKNIQLTGKRPIPGQSLTNDPENPAPFERAPEFTSVHAASEYMFERITDPKVYTNAMEAISLGTPIMNIVQAMLFVEFESGKFNPDLMYMMIEPTAYMLIFLAEQLDLEMVIYTGEMEDEDSEEQILGASFAEERLKKMQRAGQSGIVPEGALSIDVAEKSKDLPELPDLKQENQSLMSRPQGI